MSLFLTGFGLGIAFVASPGAVTAQVLKRGFERGFSAAFSLQVGALIGMGLWAMIAFAFAALLAQNMTIRLILGLVGSGLLMYLAYDALRTAYHQPQTDTEEIDSTSMRGDFGMGVALSLSNPLPIAFWLGIGNSVIPDEAKALGVDTFAIFFIGFMLSALLWSLGLSSLLGWGRRFVTPRFIRVMNAIGGLVLGVFASKLLWETVILQI